MQSIIGHENILNSILRAIDNERLAHAHLFIGEDGIGKSLVATEMGLRILGKDINCDYVDLIKWKIEKNKKSLGVGDIRKLIEEINKKPYEGDKKVVIVYEAHKMTVEAQNAFLKTIEEPPKGVFIILLCENAEMILETIKSRCQIHKFRSLKGDEIEKYIEIAHLNISKEQEAIVTAYCNGIPGRIDEFLNNENYSNIRKLVLEIMVAINESDLERFLKYEEPLTKYKDNWEDVLSYFLSYIRDIIVYKETNNKDFIVNMDNLEDIKELSNMLSFNKLNKMVSIINETRDNLYRNLNTSFVFNMMLLKIQEV